MKPQLYIHIGFPKTGSSTIQKFFNTYRNELAKVGVFYPKPLVGPRLKGHEGHCSMVEIDSRVRYDTISWQSYREMYLNSMLSEKHPINVLSSESLVYENPENLKIFTEYFQVKIICYFRNIFDFLVSGVKQVIKEGLRIDYYTYTNYFRFHLIGNIEQYIDIFGIENCFFIDYDKCKLKKSILHDFFRVLNVDIDFSKYTIKSANVTPPDSAIMFLNHLSFFPFSFEEWATIRRNILHSDLSAWKGVKCSFLRKDVFLLSDADKQLIHRQAELLNDASWYNKTILRAEQLSAIPDADLPIDVQHGMFNCLSDKSKLIISQYWPKARYAHDSQPVLPSLQELSQDSIELLVTLRRRYVVSHGNNLRLTNTIHNYQKILDEINWKNSLRRHASLGTLKKITRFFFVRSVFFQLFSAQLRQAYFIRFSSLFDLGWYLERYPDVAKADIDPVLHYVRCGAKEGRDPAPWFSTRTYLEAYPDVAASGVNPFYHYIRYGCSEGREKYSR